MYERSQYPLPVPPCSAPTAAAAAVPSSTRASTGPCPSLHDADAEDPGPVLGVDMESTTTLLGVFLVDMKASTPCLSELLLLSVASTVR